MKHDADPNDNLPMTTAEQDHRIRCRAYELYQQRGRSDGSDLQDWRRAEAELDLAVSILKRTTLIDKMKKLGIQRPAGLAGSPPANRFLEDWRPLQQPRCRKSYGQGEV